MRDAKYFIDTNIFLRAFVHDVPKQTKDCLKFLNKVSRGDYEAITSTLVLSELAWTLKSYYRVSKEKAVMILESLLSVHNLRILDRQNITLGLDIYSKHSIKYIDALIASAPEVQNGQWTIVSYDKDFDKINCKRLEPSAF